MFGCMLNPVRPRSTTRIDTKSYDESQAALPPLWFCPWDFAGHSLLGRTVFLPQVVRSRKLWLCPL